jgi:hypothetical protein
MNPIRAWNRFWFAPISARMLGVYRVVFGMMVLTNLLLISIDLDYWYTDAGVFRGTEARELAGPLRFSPLQYYQDPTTVHAVFGATAVVAVAFVLGWRTRIMSVLLYLGMLSLYHRNVATNCGPDVLLMLTCFFMMLSPCGAAVSLDARRVALRRGTPAEPLIIPWAQRLIQVQLCLVYFDTAVLKCAGTTWLTGTALHYVLFNHEVGQFNLEGLASYPILVGALTLSALWMEFALPFLLWFRPSRRWIALAGVLLHLGILPIVNAPLFGEQMTALYLLFLDRDELDALSRALNPRGWLGRRSRAELDPRSRRDGPTGLRGWHQLELGFDKAIPASRSAVP